MKGHKRSFIKYSVIVMHWCFRIKIREKERDIWKFQCVVVNSC